MNDWPVDPELDSKLRRLVDAELTAAASERVTLRRRSRGRNDRAIAGIGLLAVVVLVASLAVRMQLRSGTGEGGIDASASPSEAASPTAGATVEAPITPPGAPSGSPVVWPTPTGSLPPGATMTCYPDKSISVTLADGRVLIVGGCDASDPAAGRASEVYDPQTSKFSHTAPTSTDRGFGTATLLQNGQVLVAGGSDEAAELYDALTGTFAAAGPMNVARSLACATRLTDGRILMAGGDAGGTAEIYDPATGKFTLTGPMSATHDGYSCSALLSDGRVLVVGGEQAPAASSAEIYDPVSGKFSPTGSMASGRSVYFATAALASGKVLVVGGDEKGTAELFDPATGKFSPTGSTTRIQEVWGSAALLDGRVLVVGPDPNAPTIEAGFREIGGSVLADYRGGEPVTGRPRVTAVAPMWMMAEIYDPATGTFTAAGTMKVPRSNFSGSLLADGRYLVVGGQSDTAELFDPKTGEWTLNGG
jgi:WD40 repeat protein